jgi:hypothetical protein
MHNKPTRDHEEEFIHAVNVRGLSHRIPEKYGPVSHQSNDTAVAANADSPEQSEIISLHFLSSANNRFDRMKEDILVNEY